MNKNGNGYIFCVWWEIVCEIGISFINSDKVLKIYDVFGYFLLLLFYVFRE